LDSLPADGLILLFDLQTEHGEVVTLLCITCELLYDRHHPIDEIVGTALRLALAKRLTRLVEHMQHALLTEVFPIVVFGFTHAVSIYEKSVVVNMVDMFADEQ
jgi:hypothetical protein